MACSDASMCSELSLLVLQGVVTILRYYVSVGMLHIVTERLIFEFKWLLRNASQQSHYGAYWTWNIFFGRMYNYYTVFLILIWQFGDLSQSPN